MIRDIFKALTAAARSLFGNWPLLLTFILLHGLLLLLLWWFFATGVATVMQVVMTLVILFVAPILFFIIQALGAGYAPDDVSIGVLLKAALLNWWKLLLLSLPVLLVAWLVVYATNRFSGGEAAQASQWAGRILTAIRFVLLFVALPLVAIELWIVTARDGLRAALSGAGRSLLQALAPRAVLTWLIGMVFFGLIPWFLFFTRTPAGNAWLDMSLLGLRLVAAFLFIFLGWVVTMGALANLHARSAGNEVPAPALPMREGTVQT